MPIPGYDFLIDALALISIYLFLTISLNIEYGFAGIPNFGKLLFMSAGGFAAASLGPLLFQWALQVAITSEVLDKYRAIYGSQVDVVVYNRLLVQQINLRLQSAPMEGFMVFLLTLVIAMIVGGMLGFLCSYPAIRLRSDYLAISLLAFGEISRVIANNYMPYSYGVMIPDPFIWAGNMRFIVMTIVIFFFAVLLLCYAHMLERSPLGRVLRAMRDNELVADSLGRNITRLKQKVLIASSAISALGGALFGFYTSAVVAGTYERTSWTYWPYVMVILGGAGNNLGVVLGSVVFVVVRRLINFYKGAAGSLLPFNPVWLDYMLLGIVLLLMLIYRPSGLMPERLSPTMRRHEIEAIAKGKGEAKAHGPDAEVEPLKAT